MKTAADVMCALEAMASPSTRKTLLRHGAAEPFFGVRIGDMKPLVKQLKGQQAVALELYATGNSDAMYLAGLVANGAQMTPAQLDAWAAGATWHMIAGCPVAWVAAEHPQAAETAQRWIDSPHELTAIAGWATLAAVASVVPDSALPVPVLRKLLARCVESIHQAPGRVRYVMNSFIICCGTYVAPLAAEALAAAEKVGVVAVDMGDTACQVPEAASYIIKCRRGAPVAAKRKTARC